MKRWTIGLLVCMVLYGLGCQQVIAEAVYTCGDFLYTVNDNGEAIITGYTGIDSWLSITGCVETKEGLVIYEPLLLDGHPVSAIAAKAFAGCKSLTSLDLRHLHYVGEEAFTKCPNLRMVDLEDISWIKDNAFSGCTSLEGLWIKNGVSRIGNYAFADCTSLDFMTMFENEDLQCIGAYAFANCSMLDEVWLQSTTGNYVIEEGAFSQCSALTIACVPGVSNIGANAFLNCSTLEWIIMSPQATAIAKDAFTGCETLVASVVAGSYGEKYCQESGIAYSTQNYGFRKYSEMSDDWRYVGEGGNVVIPSVLFGKDVTRISEATFFASKRVKSVVIPEGVTHIDMDAFTDCIALENVVLPIGLEYIGTAAFSSCHSLKHIEIPETVTCVYLSFWSCSSLETVVIHSDVTELVAPFKNCPALRTIYVKRGSYAEQYCVENNLPYAWHGEYPVGRTCRIIAESARIRSGAGTEFEVVGTVARGEQYKVRGILPAANGKTWYQIKRDGMLCWISSGVCDIE